MLELEKSFGVIYSELLLLPYFDIVRYHCIDVTHNLPLGTAKNLVSVWLLLGIFKNAGMEKIQEKEDEMHTPSYEPTPFTSES